MTAFVAESGLTFGILGPAPLHSRGIVGLAHRLPFAGYISDDLTARRRMGRRFILS